MTKTIDRGMLINWITRQDNGYYYLDTWGQFADLHGYLASEDNTDGIHLTAAKYKEMYDYICGRTIEA